MNCKAGLIELRIEQRFKRAFEVLYDHYRWGAAKRGLGFGLTASEFFELTQMDCFYCGCKPEQILLKSGKRVESDEAPVYNGVDRVDNEEGYIYTNCVPCCGTCNRMKRALGFKAFTKKVKDIAENMCLCLS